MLRHLFPRKRTWLTLVIASILSILLTGYYPYQTSERPAFYGAASVLQLDLETTDVTTLIGGKKTFIFYFLPTCPHCQESAPTVARLANKYAGQIQFLGVASGQSRLSEVRDFKETYKLPFTVVQDSGSTFGNRNGQRAYPGFLLTDGSPTPPESYNSFSPDMEALLEIAIVRFLGRNPLPLLDPDKYYGSLVCSSCHREEYISWSTNHHAIAMNTLYQTKRDADPKCIGCHVVGYGQPGGFQDVRSTPWLAEVGCESCHGRAGGHNKKLSDAERAARARQTPEEKYGPQCLQCHDADHSIGFDVKKGIPLVGHHADRTLSEVDFLARRSQLVQGEVARPLLEFPDGQIQGQQVCQSCHKAIHTGWQKDPHSRAMDTLKQKGKDQDVSCVKCHAILKDKTRPDAIDAYLPGVQCESCHGSGEAHIKAKGGKGNIVALTSSCPVCVIDALCTSCHTKEQDADFDLDKALELVKRSHRNQAH